MRALILVSVLLLAIAASASYIAEQEAWSHFNNFVQTHQKTYSSFEEFHSRFNVFKQNLQRLETLKREHPLASFKLNKFSDLTHEEFINTYTGARSGAANGFRCDGPKAHVPNKKFPEHVDWRSKGAVTAVKDQGMCGSCWAFSTVGNIEGVVAVAGKHLTPLSEQNLVDCDHECNKDGVCDSGCDGGLMDSAMKFVLKNKGVALESKYPYKGSDGKCRYKSDMKGASISDYACLPNDEDKMAAFSADHGPVAVAINANPLQFYSGGVLTPTKKSCDPDELNHGVLIVGWGEEKNKKFWIVKNSWGEDWGEQGYVRLARGQNACGIATFPVSAIA